MFQIVIEIKKSKLFFELFQMEKGVKVSPKDDGIILQ